MFKHVAGTGNVDISAEEEAAIRSEWAETDKAMRHPKAEKLPTEKLVEFLNANPDVKALIDE
jgi:hypothetical protein